MLIGSCAAVRGQLTGSLPLKPRLRGEALHPSVDRDVIDFDAALGEQLLHISVGERVPQVPADRDGDHRRREPEPANADRSRIGRAVRR
jgi:hypothetical protein